MTTTPTHTGYAIRDPYRGLARAPGAIGEGDWYWNLDREAGNLAENETVAEGYAPNMVEACALLFGAAAELELFCIDGSPEGGFAFAPTRDTTGDSDNDLQA